MSLKIERGLCYLFYGKWKFGKLPGFANVKSGMAGCVTARNGAV